ncbi:MAG: DegT/DnrJ/EryC1/StrS family aminotransferase [Bacteroidetes bacterium]|nr:DegT/DnrJ/EryC1/StrS family aminotransferase [Bacteroidota bacterium]
MKVNYIHLGIQHKEIKQDILDSIGKLLDNGQFILGEETQKFEKRFADLCQTKYAIGVGNGTDTMILSMRALGIGAGDEVITAPNSYLASASSIALAGATPVFADVRQDYNIDPIEIERKITKKTKAIIPVHLTGRPADMDAILAIAKAHNLHVIEDAAQAVGAKYNNKAVGSFGITGSFSLHPLKNLAACGDGGVITTNDDNLFSYLTKARTHGHSSRDEVDFWSFNTRIDNLQAAILNVKFNELDKWNNRRRAIAGMYREGLKNLPLYLPTDTEKEHSVYHTFIIQSERRDALMKFLSEQGIDTKIHYPVPIHLQKAASYLGYKKGDFPVTEKQCETILSLPVFPQLTDEEVNYVIEKINLFFK